MAQKMMEEAQVRVSGLSKHKHPRAWVALEALTRNAQGKVNRREVRAVIERRYELWDGPRPKLELRLKS